MCKNVLECLLLSQSLLFLPCNGFAVLAMHSCGAVMHCHSPTNEHATCQQTPEISNMFGFLSSYLQALIAYSAAASTFDTTTPTTLTLGAGPGLHMHCTECNALIVLLCPGRQGENGMPRYFL